MLQLSLLQYEIINLCPLRNATFLLLWMMYKEGIFVDSHWLKKLENIKDIQYRKYSIIITDTLTIEYFYSVRVT
jgi:hypothetical protein